MAENQGQNARNTPTCVGKTYRMGWVHEEIWKHPHMRGEDSMNHDIAVAVAETPPHAWGRRFRCVLIFYGNRNTPTCVGKTLNDH